MTYSEIDKWYDLWDIDWDSFDTKADALAEMDRLADIHSGGSGKGSGLKQAIRSRGFQSSAGFQSRLNVFGTVATTELEELEIDINQATNISAVEQIETKKDVNKSKIKTMKDKRITEIREEKEFLFAQSQQLEAELLDDIEELFNTARQEDRLAALQLWSEDVGQFDGRISELEEVNKTAAVAVRRQIKAYRNELSELEEPELE